MKTCKIKFSGDGNVSYVLKSEVTDFFGQFSLYSVNGIIPKGGPISLDMAHQVNIKPDVVFKFPSIESVEAVLNSLIELRENMIEKKGMFITEEAISQVISDMEPGKVIAGLREQKRKEMGRPVGLEKQLMSMMNRVNNQMKQVDDMIKDLQNPAKEDKSVKENRAEPAAH